MILVDIKFLSSQSRPRVSTKGVAECPGEQQMRASSWVTVCNRFVGLTSTVGAFFLRVISLGFPM